MEVITAKDIIKAIIIFIIVLLCILVPIVIAKISTWLERKNPCNKCDFYCKENNTCQSKKCATCGNHSEVTFIDRLFCKPYNSNNKR